MAKVNVHEFPSNLEGFNNFYALPAAWQPQVLTLLGHMVSEGILKTNEELGEVALKFEHVTEDRLPGSDEYTEGFGEALDQLRLGSYFATILIQQFSGSGSSPKINPQELTLEQNERSAEITAEFYVLLKDLVNNISVDSEITLAQAWVILLDYVETYSEEQRELFAIDYRSKNFPQQ